MNEQTVRKTYKEKLRPTPAQERALDDVLWRCRALYNTALEQRITAWQRRHVSVSRFEQEAELKAIRAEFPEYAAIHSHVLQDVLARLDKTYQAFFRRVQRGEKAGFPRFKGRNRFHSFTFKEYGNGATLDNGFLVSPRSGGSASTGAARLRARPRPSRSPGRPTAGMSRFPAPRCRRSHCRRLDRRPGIDLGLGVLRHAGGWHAHPHAGLLPQGGTRIWPSASAGSRGARRGATAAARRCVLLAKAHQTVRRQRQDFHHKTALSLVRQYDTIYHEDLQVANMVKNHHLAKSICRCGVERRFSPS